MPFVDFEVCKVNELVELGEVGGMCKEFLDGFEGCLRWKF